MRINSRAMIVSRAVSPAKAAPEDTFPYESASSKYPTPFDRACQRAIKARDALLEKGRDDMIFIHAVEITPEGKYVLRYTLPYTGTWRDSKLKAYRKLPDSRIWKGGISQGGSSLMRRTLRRDLA